MNTTDINKTVYRSDVISSLDSFTSVRNVLAWEMFQDGQVRNYDGVVNDLQRLYPNIDFDSVTENIDPESIAADEDAIYALVDNIINKLIESGISKDNFNYAIWACDDPENVVDSYGVDIDDVSAYEITDGILLQDLGYEGQLYGVAEYPEEDTRIFSKITIPNKFGDIFPSSKIDDKILKDFKNAERNRAFPKESDNAQVASPSTNPPKNLECTITFETGMYKEQDVFYRDTLNDINGVLKSKWKLSPIAGTLPINTTQIIYRKVKNNNYPFKATICVKEVNYVSRDAIDKTVIQDDYYYGDESFGELLLNLLLANSFQGGNMETREDYKDYYLEQLIENYGDMTECDYNSAQKFCYDEEWNLGEVGNMAEAIDGLGDAWSEYQKQYKEGFEIMNSKNITSWVAEPKPKFDFDTHTPEQAYKLGFENYWNWRSFESTTVRNFTGACKCPYTNPELKKKYYEGWNKAEKMSVTSSKKNIKSSKDSDLDILTDYLDDNWGNESRRDIFKKFKQEHPETSLEFIDFVKYQNDYDVNDDTPYEYEDENGRLYTWDMIKKDLDDWVNSGQFEKDWGEGYIDDYKNPDGTLNYEKLYDEFWDIGANGAMSYIGSSLEPEWTAYEPHFKNLKPRHEDDPDNLWGEMVKEQKELLEKNNYKVFVKYGYGGSCTLYGAETGNVIAPFGSIKDMLDFKKKNNLTIVKNSRGNDIIKSSYKDNHGIEDLKLVSEQAEEYAGNILSAARDWIPSEEYNQFQKKEFKSGDWTVVVDPNSTYGWNGAGLGIYYYYKTQYCPIFEKEYKLNQQYDYESQSWNNLLVQTPRRANGLRDLTAGNSEKTNSMGIDWEEVLRTLKTIVSSKRGNNMIKSSKAQKIFDKAILKAAELVKKSNDEEIFDEEGNEKLNNELSDITVNLVDLPFDFELEPQELKSYIKKIVPADYFDDDRCWFYLYDVVYDDIYQWIGFNTKSVNSSKKLIMSKTLSQSEREGMEVVLGIICGYYGADEDDDRYLTVREQLSPEELNQLDEICTYVLADEQDYKTVSDRVLKEDIPLLRKVYNIIDDNDLFKNSQGDYDWDAMSGFEKICLTSSRRINMKKTIKSANGSWEYQLDDMDEVEEKIGDIGISFTEPLLLADDGTLYTRAGFDQWLKYLEREEGDNWADAYESYHRDTDEEFIKMCQDDFFQHDFGHTLTIYPEGLKSIAESVAEEIPSNEAPFAIPSGFAFNLYGEEEEPSGFNSYWVDDMSLNSESFIWGINPKFGNRFDVVIDPDYLWNGTENIQSSKKGEKKMKIQSKRVIKSGTSNFGSNDDVYGYSFPLVAYMAETYIADEETGEATEERDYDAENWEYEDAISNAEDLAYEMDVPLIKDYHNPDYAPAFCISIESGYYEGLWVKVVEGGDTMVYNDEIGDYEDIPESEFNAQADKINDYLDKLCSDYGWIKLGVTARFSNGETWYSKIDNSRKPVISGLTFRQAVQDFKAAGHWSDYYEMQQDWESYKDGLERDGVISEKTRSTWGNPCTPETFKRWNK